jgi:type IV pilus assembly protein PilB
MTVATANLVGITGIARRLVLDGVLDEATRGEAMEEATKERSRSRYLLEKKLVTVAQVPPPTRPSSACRSSTPRALEFK